MFFCCPGLLKAHFVRWLFDRLFRTNERVKTGNNHTSPNPLQAGTDVSQLKNMRYVFMPAPKLTSILINHEQWYWSCKSSFLNMIAQASKAHVTSVLHKFTISQEIRCCVTSNHWDFVWEIKYWGLQMLNIIIIFTFFLQNKKGRLTFDVFLCFLVWIHQFNWIFLLLLYDPMSLSSWYEVKAAQKNSQRSGPCLLKGGLWPENPSNRSFFFQPEANFYHRYTAVIAPHLLPEMSIFSCHVQNTFVLQMLWFREWTRHWSEVKFPLTKV